MQVIMQFIMHVIMNAIMPVIMQESHYKHKFDFPSNYNSIHFKGYRIISDFRYFFYPNMPVSLM